MPLKKKRIILSLSFGFREKPMINILFICIYLLISFNTYSCSSRDTIMAEQVIDNQKFTQIRLPTNVKPIHYDLSLKPDLNKFIFQGSVKIEYKATESVKLIVLHALELEVYEGYVQNNDGNSKITLPLSKVTYSPDSETISLEFDGKEVPLLGFLFLKFKGILNDKLKGFYRTTFKLDNQDVYAATSKFEPTDARRCLPCWDEPAIKASFTVELIHVRSIELHGDMNKTLPIVALSNMPAKTTETLATGEAKTTFEKSPIMSTYLLAFIVGPFEMIQQSLGDRYVRVITTPGKQELGRFALEVGCKAVKFFEDYFKVDYPLPKLDLIAIPDFGSGAMENWGLITFRENALLVDSNNPSTDVKQTIAVYVAHEVAHQWFGNLVTMEWWTHLWLNEGFACCMEFFCVSHMFPEYDMWSQFLTDAYGLALDLDSLHNSHPIEVPVNHPSEIKSIFDLISYKKGASIIRMLYNYIGDEAFRKGMNQYLTKFAYKNAVTEDLWESLGAASGKPIRQFMSSWTSQKGYPWLSVGMIPDGDTTRLTLTQSKFTADGKLSKDEENALWSIHIEATTSNNPTKNITLGLLEVKKQEFSIKADNSSWIKLNPGTIGLMRIVYPDEMSEKLRLAISNQSLPAMDRLGVIEDSFALSQAGKVSIITLLRLIEAYVDESDSIVWQAIDRCMGKLKILISYTDSKDKFDSFGVKLYAKIFKRLTWEPKSDEKHTDTITRARIISRLVSLGDETVIEEAKRRFNAHLEGKDVIPADLRGAVYRAISKYGDDESFENLFKIHKNSELQEKDRVLRNLGYTKDVNRLKKVIDFVLSDEVRTQDKPFGIIPIGIASPAIGWKLFQDKKDIFNSLYGSNYLLFRIIQYTTQDFATEEMAQEISKFFEKNKFPGAERTIQQSLESIRIRAGWLTRDQEAIKAFFS